MVGENFRGISLSGKTPPPAAPIRVYLALLKISTFEKIVFFSSTLRHSALLEEFRSTIEEASTFQATHQKCWLSKCYAGTGIRLTVLC